MDQVISIDAGSDADVLAAADAFIFGRSAGEVLDAHYHRANLLADDALVMLAELLPEEQVPALQMAETLGRSDLHRVVFLLAILSRSQGNEAWVHYNLAKYLGDLCEAGVREAKLPAIIHAQFAIEGLKGAEPVARWLPLKLLARELSAVAPGEAVRCDVLAAQANASRSNPVARPSIRDDKGTGKVPLVNVALHRPATQSSDSGHRCPSKPLGSNATCGVKTAGFGFHTNTEPDPWWMLDLQRVREIHQVVDYNRDSANPDNANTMSVALAMDPAGPWNVIHQCNGGFGGILRHPPLIVSPDQPIRARYVLLQLHETKAFHLDEVEVFAPVSSDDPVAARIAEVYASLERIPEELRDARTDVVNSDAWNWAVFRGKCAIDAPRMHSRWFGRKPRFDIDPEVPFDGEIRALRVWPAGGIGNAFYDILNAALIARCMRCTALEVPNIEGGLDHLPVVVDDLRIEPTRSSDAKRPTLEASFYWPNGFEPLLGDYGSDFLLDTIRRFIKPIFARYLNAAKPLDDNVLVIHFRGGEIFGPGGNHRWYVQPPASFYLMAVKFAMANLGVSAVHLVFQDRLNPSVDIVSDYLTGHGIPFTAQSSSLFEDMVTMMSARHSVVAFGTFGEAIGLLSEHVRTYIGFRSLSTQRGIAYWAQSRVEQVLRANGVRTAVIDDPDQSYIAPET